MRTSLWGRLVREVVSSILLICNAPRPAPGTPQTATRPPGDSPPCVAGLRLFFYRVPCSSSTAFPKARAEGSLESPAGPRINSWLIRMRTLNTEHRRCMASNSKFIRYFFLFRSHLKWWPTTGSDNWQVKITLLHKVKTKKHTGIIKLEDCSL